MKPFHPLVAMLILSGCAHYAPVPLSPDPVILVPPIANILEKEATAIQRPWLAPVTFHLSAPLTDDAIATLAVVNNPDLKALRARAGVSDAQVFAAGLVPDPSVSLGASKVMTGPDPFLDLASAIGIDINALRTRGATRAKAREEARQVRLDLAWAEWQTAGQARIQAARIMALKRNVGLALQSQESAQSLLERTQRAAGRGDIPGDRLQAVRLSALSASETLRTSEKDLVASREELDKLLGFPPGTTLALADMALPDMPPPVETLFAIARDNRADLQALQAGYAAQEAAVHKAVLDQFPALNLSINNNRDSAGNYLAGPAIDFTLPLWNRNRGGIAVERATRTALKAEYEARLFQARADIGAARAGIALAFRQRAEAEQGLASLRDYAGLSRQAAVRGDLSLEAAQNAEQALRDRLTLVAQSDQNIHEQMIALELLTGAPREAWTQ